MGSDAVVPEKDQNHPLMPDEVIYAGRRIPVNYQPTARCAAAPELPPQRRRSRGTGAGDAGTGSLKSAVALEETNAGRTVVASDVDLSLVELCRATLALDDLQTHMTGLMFNFLNQIATEHSGQASSLVETLYARIKERSRRTAKAPNWPELLQRRGFSKKTFNDAVEGLKQIPDAALFRERLLSKLAGSRNERWVARVTGKLTQCSREKILSGTANRWHSDQAAIDALCEEADNKNHNDEALFESISNYLQVSLPVLNEYEIYALAIYEMSQWNLRQTLV